LAADLTAGRGGFAVAAGVALVATLTAGAALDGTAALVAVFTAGAAAGLTASDDAFDALALPTTSGAGGGGSVGFRLMV
jgi:hypothetical protein